MFRSLVDILSIVSKTITIVFVFMFVIMIAIYIDRKCRRYRMVIPKNASFPGKRRT